MNHKRENWVAARAKCTLPVEFLNLEHALRQDIDNMQELPADMRRGHRFTLERVSNGTILLIRRYLEKDPNRPPVELSCTCHRDKIVVETEGQEPLAIRLSWDAQKGACELCIDKKCYDVSAISQKILGPFFFDVE